MFSNLYRQVGTRYLFKGERERANVAYLNATHAAKNDYDAKVRALNSHYGTAKQKGSKNYDTKYRQLEAEYQRALAAAEKNKKRAHRVRSSKEVTDKLIDPVRKALGMKTSKQIKKELKAKKKAAAAQKKRNREAEMLNSYYLEKKVQQEQAAKRQRLQEAELARAKEMQRIIEEQKRARAKALGLRPQMPTPKTGQIPYGGAR